MLPHTFSQASIETTLQGNDAEKKCLASILLLLYNTSLWALKDAIIG